MFSIKNLNVTVQDKPILHALNMDVAPGTVHILMGPNGSGKSSVAHTIMGNPLYTVTGGALIFNGSSIHELSPEKRAQLGLFLSFQNPPEIPGVRVMTFLKEMHRAATGLVVDVKEFQDMVFGYMAMLNMDISMAYRSLEGFSGGEKKRLEMLQLLLLQPALAILDEIDSGLDVDGLQLVGNALAHVRTRNPHMAIVCITHHQKIGHYIVPDFVHILSNGSITASGSIELMHSVEQHGYAQYQSTP